MAGEEDVELRDLVAQTLEAKGVLGKIRAQLRASVFLALEEQESQQRPHPLVSSKLEQFQKTKDGKLVTALVREFLDYFELEYTSSVFDPETNALESYPGRERLAKDLNLDPQAASNGPLLAQLVQNVLSPPPPPPPSSSSRQLKFPDTVSSSHTASSDTSTLVSTACSDAGRTAVASGGGSLYSQATPTLHSLGTLAENDSERLSHNFTQSQLNDKHMKQPTASLNSNGNSNTEGGMESRLATQPRSDFGVPSGLPGVEGLGVGLGGLQSPGAFAELGESFVNSADSSFDVDKLNTENERLLGVLKPSSAGVGVNREELDDFFDSSILPSALQDSKDEDLLKDSALATTKRKSDELGKEQDAYDDDFHSEELSSHVTEQLDDPSLQLETEDRTFSQSSLTVDYIEPIHS